MDEFQRILTDVFALGREGKADVLDYLVISIVDEAWHYRSRGKAHEEIIKATLSLDLESRITLRDKLMEERDPEIERSWIEECKRRIEAYDRGEMEAIDGDEAIARVRKSLRIKKE